MKTTITLLCVLIATSSEAVSVIKSRNKVTDTVTSGQAAPVVVKVEAKDKKQASPRPAKALSDADRDRIDQLLAQNQEALKEVQKRKIAPRELGNEISFQTGKMFRGTLMNSIRSTSLESPIKILADSNQGLPDGTYFWCKGVTKFKTVLTVCNRLLMPDHTLEIDAQALNTDGTSGLRGDYADGKDSLIAGTILVGAAQGLISMKQQSVSTLAGEVTPSTARNQVLGAALGGLNSTGDIIKEELAQREPIITVNAGEKVVVVLNEDIRYEDQ